MLHLVCSVTFCLFSLPAIVYTDSEHFGSETYFSFCSFRLVTFPNVATQCKMHGHSPCLEVHLGFGKRHFQLLPHPSNIEPEPSPLALLPCLRALPLAARQCPEGCGWDHRPPGAQPLHLTPQAHCTRWGWLPPGCYGHGWWAQSHVEHSPGMLRKDGEAWPPP